MSSEVQLGNTVVDLIRGELRSGGRTTSLSPLEASLLAYLGRREGSVIPKDEILREVMGYRDGVQSRAADASILRLRKKLQDTDVSIESVYGRGVQLRVDRPASTAQTKRIPGPALVGRDEDESELVALLQTPGLVCLWGPHGVGKSTVAKRLPDTHVLQGIGTDAIEQEACRILGCRVEGISSALTRSATRFVLDDAESRSDDEMELVRAWSAYAPVLVVSVPRIDADREHRLHPLSPDDATQLLVTLCDPLLDTRQAAELQAGTDRLPQELTLLSEALRFLGVDAFMELGTVGVFPLMTQAVEAMYRSLQPRERSVLESISTFEGAFDVQAAACVCDLQPYAVLPSLQLLWSAAMLQGERGVYCLLAPVRDVARRHSVSDGLDGLIRWSERLLEDDVRGGHRFVRHREDLHRLLVTGPDHVAPVAGILLLENAIWDPTIAGLLEAASSRDGHIRPVVLCLRALLWTSDRTEARSLVDAVDRPLATPEQELLRQAARLAVGPHDGDGASLLAMAEQVSLPLFALVLCLVGAAGWTADFAVFARQADLCELANLPGAAISLRTWAARAARRTGRPDWYGLARRAGMEARVSVEIVAGDPTRALEVALSELERHPSHQRKHHLAGMAANIAIVLGDREMAEELVQRYPSSGRGLGTQLQLARALLGKPAVFQQSQHESWVKAWRDGHPPQPVLEEHDYLFRWILANAPKPAPSAS